MWVLGISCYYHDSAVALIDDGRIVFAIHEERLSRRKQDSRFPTLAIGRALEETGCAATTSTESSFTKTRR